MTPRPSSARCSLLLALLAALMQPGCVSTAPKPPPAESATAEAFRTSLKNARTEGREEIEDILGIYANLPAEQAPGVAALRRDIAEALAALKREGRDRLSSDEVDKLTVRNPNFWHAWFEFDPRDSSLLMLHSSLLMEAGEVFRASMVLTVGVQALPLNVQERVFWFTQQARTHWTAFRRLDELNELEKTWHGDRRAREAGLARIVRDWPADGFALEALLQSRAGFKPGTISGEDNAPVVLAPAARARVAKELAQLRRVNPVAAVRYAEDRAAAAEFGRLWTCLVDEDRAIEQRELVQFAAQARRLGLGELALLAGKAVAYALWGLKDRGEMFVSPGDALYEGMIVGVNNKGQDIIVNACREKKQTNMRSSGSDEAMQLTPPRELTLEIALEFIEDDELVEITPKNIRLRKTYLTENERLRNRRKQL